MVNPQESESTNCVFTQFSEMTASDMSATTESESPTKAKASKPSPQVIRVRAGDKIVHFQFGVNTPSSSSDSFTSPESKSDTIITQEDSKLPAKKSVVVKTEPVAKRAIQFDEENKNPQPSKKAKKAKCCGRCLEYRKMCLKLEKRATDDFKKKYQYQAKEKNKKHRKRFYDAFSEKPHSLEPAFGGIDTVGGRSNDQRLRLLPLDTFPTPQIST